MTYIPPLREGPKCGCGSGQPRRPLFDGNGLFCAYVCDGCVARVKARYRPEIMNRPYTRNDVDEDIDGDE
jgi:hypothetical protein